MIRINLLAVEREKTRRRSAPPLQASQKVTLACTVILLGTGLVIGWWYFALAKASARVDEDIAAAQRETARLRSLIQQVQVFEQRRQQLQQRVSLIEQLRKGQSGPVHMLDAISRSLPDMLWLTELKQQGADITIAGRCTSLTALSDFVGNLESSGYFRKPVEIIDSQVEQSSEGQVEVIKFSIKGQFAPPAS